jgi:hypothetical protein
VTSVYDRLVALGWVESYVTTADYRIQALFTAQGVAALSKIREVLAPIRPVSDLEMSALLWIIDTNLPK